jgi:hypothetical protein
MESTTKRTNSLKKVTNRLKKVKAPQAVITQDIIQESQDILHVAQDILQDAQDVPQEEIKEKSKLARIAQDIIVGLIIGIGVYIGFAFSVENYIEVNNLVRQRALLQDTLQELHALNMSPVQATYPNLQFATETAAEIIPQPASGEILTENEEDFLDSVNHIRNSGEYSTIEEQDAIIASLRILLNL